jgi:acetyl-CoA acyltransferase
MDSPFPRTSGVRIGVVDGYRTPFTKAGGELASMNTLDLSIAVVRELAERAEVSPREIDSLVMGSAVAYPKVPYLARETAIALNWMRTDAYSAEAACATSARTIINAAYGLLTGEADVAIAGGAESMSNVPVEAKPKLREALVQAQKNPGDMMGLLMGLTLGDLFPNPPGVAEPYTGKTLGEHAEELVRDFDITRAEADAFAVESHHKAAAALADGRLPAETIPVITNDWGVVKEDSLVRADTSLEKVAALPPVFDREYGTVTAANASPLTDGAAAVLLMTENAAERLGKTPRAWIRSWAFTSHDPNTSTSSAGRAGVGVLLGPAFSLPLALERAGLSLDDLGLIDIHEAFAGQVLANLKAMASDEFNRTHLGREALGEVNRERLNVAGGSVSIGHPFGATGGRLVTQLTKEMERRNVRYGALAICAGGTRGASIVLERDV